MPTPTTRRVQLYNRKKKDDGKTVKVKLGPGRHARDLESGEYVGPGEEATVKSYQLKEIPDLGDVLEGEDPREAAEIDGPIAAPRRGRK